MAVARVGMNLQSINGSIEADHGLGEKAVVFFEVL